MADGQYPEAEKLAAAGEDMEMIRDFLEQYADEGKLAIVDGNTIRGLLYDYFEVDDEKLETERRVMLQQMRIAHETAHTATDG